MTHSGGSVAITGSSGYLGGLVAKRLIKEGATVIHVTRKPEELDKRFGSTLCISSELDADSLGKSFERNQVETVLHFATFFTKEDSPEIREKCLESNYNFPVRVFEASKSSASRFLNVNSVWQVQEGSSADLPYVSSKELFRKYLADHSGGHIGVSNLFLTDTFGPGDPRGKVVSSMISARARSGPSIISNPDARIDLSYSLRLSGFVNDYVSQSGTVFENLLYRNYRGLSLKELEQAIDKAFSYFESGKREIGDLSHQTAEADFTEGLPLWMNHAGSQLQNFLVDDLIETISFDWGAGTSEV
jgi:nucleoside-diphosphate-sugar epimerase